MEQLKKTMNTILIEIGTMKNEMTHITSHNTTFRDQMNAEVAKLNVLVNGNGHPEQGLVYKVQQNTDFRTFWAKFGWIILTALTGIPCVVVTSVAIAYIKSK